MAGKRHYLNISPLPINVSAGFDPGFLPGADE